MLTLKSFRHIRTSRNIKGFWLCQHATGESLAHLDAQRMAREEARLAAGGETPSARGGMGQTF
jgi:hypothetical protein